MSGAKPRAISKWDTEVGNEAANEAAALADDADAARALMAVANTDIERGTAMSINYYARPNIGTDLSRVSARRVRSRVIGGVLPFAVAAAVATELRGVA